MMRRYHVDTRHFHIGLLLPFYRLHFNTNGITTSIMSSMYGHTWTNKIAATEVIPSTTSGLSLHRVLTLITFAKQTLRGCGDCWHTDLSYHRREHNLQCGDGLRSHLTSRCDPVPGRWSPAQTHFHPLCFLDACLPTS